MTSPDSLIGRQIDQFRLDQFIASGAMGMVFKSYDTVLHRTVALKLISKKADSSPTMDEARRRLIQEAMAAGRLCHPNIVTIHCYGETEDFQYICMEHVTGKTLAEVLDAKKVLDTEEAVDIFEQVILALEAANQEHIVHRDIKPSNIMITPDKRVKVMDFGIAKLPSLSATTTGTVLGTPFYMSPEQISGQKVDIRSDIFSVGAVLYQVLTGQKPFDAESTVTLAYKIVQVEPIPPKILNIYIPHALEGICKKALAKDPVLRYQTPAEMLKVIRELKEKGCASSSPADTTIKTKDLQWDKTIQIKRPEARKEDQPPSSVETPPPSRSSSSPSSDVESRQNKAEAEQKPSAPASTPPKMAVPSGEPSISPSVKDKAEAKKIEEVKEEDSPRPVPPAPKPTAAKKGTAPSKSEKPVSKKTISGKTLGIFLVLLVIVAGVVLFYHFRKNEAQYVSQPSAVAPAQPLESNLPTTSPPDTPTAQVVAPSTPPTVPQTTSPPATLSRQPSVDNLPVPAPNIGQSQTGQVQPQDNADTLVQRAKSQIESDPAAAQGLLELALTLDPNNSEAILQMARLLTFRKDFQKAISYYQKALQLNFQAPEIYFNLGYIYLTLGNYDLAIQSYENCLRLSPPFTDEVLTNLAICHIKMNNPRQAKGLLQQALQVNPKNELAQYYLRTIGGDK